MFPDIILNGIDEISCDSYTIYVDKNKDFNALILRIIIKNTKEEIEFATLPLNIYYYIRLTDDYVYILENKKIVLSFNVNSLIKVAKLEKYHTPLILKRKK